MYLPTPSLLARWPLIAGIFAAGSAAAITPADLAGRLTANDPILLIDVRSTMAYGDGHIPGAINIPLGLLPDKPVPSGMRIVVYGDGLGVVDDTKALAGARAKAGVAADVLEGGYAAWLSETRLSTALPGVGRERLPGLTYQQLIAAGKSDMVLVDLRASVSSAASTAASKKPATAALASASEGDILADFARKIGVPVVSGSDPSTLTVAKGAVASKSTAAAPQRAAARVDVSSASNKLLVLVADSDTEANEVARQLRAAGNYRFTILIGGTDIIRHEGKQGSGRMDGSTPALQTTP